jgi:hypothetical protein
VLAGWRQVDEGGLLPNFAGERVPAAFTAFKDRLFASSRAQVNADILHACACSLVFYYEEVKAKFPSSLLLRHMLLAAESEDQLIQWSKILRIQFEADNILGIPPALAALGQNSSRSANEAAGILIQQCATAVSNQTSNANKNHSEVMEMFQDLKRRITKLEEKVDRQATKKRRVSAVDEDEEEIVVSPQPLVMKELPPWFDSYKSKTLYDAFMAWYEFDLYEYSGKDVNFPDFRRGVAILKSFLPEGMVITRKPMKGATQFDTWIDNMKGLAMKAEESVLKYIEPIKKAEKDAANAKKAEETGKPVKARNRTIDGSLSSRVRDFRGKELPVNNVVDENV